MTDPINATSDQSTATLFLRLPYKLPAVALTTTLAALVMRMSSFGINDSIVAALGLGIMVWMGLIYVQSFRRWRIHRAIFTKYPKGIVWNSVCFHDKNSVGLLKSTIMRLGLQSSTTHSRQVTRIVNSATLIRIMFYARVSLLTITIIRLSHRDLQ